MSHDIEKTVKTYKVVLSSLLVLTVVTVAASYLDLSLAMTITLALVIATVKAGLVACYFMHLIDERRFIYGVLALTLLFFLVLMLMPTWWGSDVIIYRN